MKIFNYIFILMLMLKIELFWFNCLLKLNFVIEFFIDKFYLV